MTTFQLVTAARQATLSKLFAVMLIVLTTVPFTAPFASFSPADIPGEGSECAGSPNAKTSEKATVSPHIDPVIVSMPLWSARPIHASCHFGVVGQIRPAVLRV
jgi:hypothetical protein